MTCHVIWICGTTSLRYFARLPDYTSVAVQCTFNPGWHFLGYNALVWSLALLYDLPCDLDLRYNLAQVLRSVARLHVCGSTVYIQPWMGLRVDLRINHVTLFAFTPRTVSQSHKNLFR
eukprot:jgi/Botrbrau1/7833/Bobra.9_2s0014.1